MGLIAELGRTAWRKYVTEGIPSSGAHDPRKEDIWSVFDEIDERIEDVEHVVSAGAIYKGTWDAATNTPAIPAAEPENAGWFYYVSVPGATSIDGISTWEVGDRIISTGEEWTRVPSGTVIERGLIGLTANLDLMARRGWPIRAGVQHISVPEAPFAPGILFTASATRRGVGPNRAWREAEPGVARHDYDPISGVYRGILYEAASATNHIRNNTAAGAVAGSPGTMPTGWEFYGTNISELSVDVAGKGTEDGIDYCDFRIHGTTTTSFSLSIRAQNPTQTVAETGQLWTLSAFLKILTGGARGASNVRLFHRPRNSGGSTTQSLLGPDLPITDERLGTQRYAYTAELTAANAAMLEHSINIYSGAATTVDFVLRVGWPQAQQGGAATSPVLTSNAAVTAPGEVLQVPIPVEAFDAEEHTLQFRGDLGIGGADTTTRRLLHLDDGVGGGGGNYVGFNRSSGGNVRLRVFRDSVDQYSAFLLVPEAGEEFTIAGVAKTGRFAAALNGKLSSQFTPGAEVLPAVQPVLKVGFGGTSSGAMPAMHILEFAYFGNNPANRDIEVMSSPYMGGSGGGGGGGVQNTVYTLFAEPIVDPSRELYITWVNSEQAARVLEIRPLGGATWAPLSSFRTRAFPSSAMWLHTAEAIGLAPDTIYEVRVVGSTFSDTIKTAPARWPLRIVLASDWQVNDYTEAGALGRLGDIATARDDYDLLWLGGDYVNDDGQVNGTETGRWLSFLQTLSQRWRTREGALYPWLAIVGNHEGHNAANDGSAGRDGTGTLGYVHHVFTWSYDELHPTRFCNSAATMAIGNKLRLVTYESDHTEPIGDQVPWLLDRIEEAPAYRHNFIMGHVPPFSSYGGGSSGETSNSSYIFPAARTGRNALWMAAQEHASRIRAWLGGHSHLLMITQKLKMAYDDQLSDSDNDSRFYPDPGGLRQLGLGPIGTAMIQNQTTLDRTSSISGHESEHYWEAYLMRDPNDPNAFVVQGDIAGPQIPLSHYWEMILSDGDWAARAVNLNGDEFYSIEEVVA